MEFLFFIAFLAEVAFPVLLLIALVALAARIGRRALHAQTGIGLGGADEFTRSMAVLQKLIAQAQAAQASQAETGGPALPPALQAQWQTALWKTQAQLRDREALRQGHHEVFVGDMMRQASSAGLDVGDLKY